MKRSRALSPIFTVSLALLLLSLAALILSHKVDGVAVFLNRYIGGFIRAFLSALNYPFKFSIFEVAILLSPLMIASAVVYIFRGGITVSSVRRRFLNVISIIVLIASLYIWTVGIAYASPPLYSGLVDEHFAPNEQDVYSAAEHLAARILESYAEPDEYVEKMKKSYSNILSEHPLAEPPVRAKSVLFSGLMHRLGILGLYSFPTGEVNLNAHLPASAVPITLAHEYAHLLGASGEADADFMAYISAVNSDSPYLRYCGYLSALELILPMLKACEQNKIYDSLPKAALDDITSFYEFIDKYQGRLKNSMDNLNAAHADAFDKSGNKQYPYATRLMIAYIKNNP